MMGRRLVLGLRLKPRSTTLAVAAFCCMAVVATATIFTFIGSPSGTWGNENVWDASVGTCGSPCIPETINDDVIFDAVFEVDLDATRTIDDMYISDANISYFTTDVNSPKTLTCDSIEIGTGSIRSVVTLRDKATVIALAPAAP